MISSSTSSCAKQCSGRLAGEDDDDSGKHEDEEDDANVSSVIW